MFTWLVRFYSVLLQLVSNTTTWMRRLQWYASVYTFMSTEQRISQVDLFEQYLKHTRLRNFRCLVCLFHGNIDGLNKYTISKGHFQMHLRSFHIDRLTEQIDKCFPRSRMLGKWLLSLPSIRKIFWEKSKGSIKNEAWHGFIQAHRDQIHTEGGRLRILKILA